MIVDPAKPIVGRTLSVHKEHELLLKLEAAGLIDDLAQKVIDSKGNELAKKLVGLISGNYSVSETKSTSVIPINRFSPFNPEEFIGKKGKGWMIEEEDERSLKLTELDLAKVRLETTLKRGESSVNGEEKLRRLKKLDCIRLDAKVFQALWENKHLIPGDWKGKTIFFVGTIFRGRHGDRYILALFWGGSAWGWNSYWLDCDWGAHDPSAVLAA